MRDFEDTIEIPEWANGPDGSGNGGWTAGLLSGHVPGGASGAVVVNLRMPPPVGRPLRVVDGSGEEVLLLDDAGADPLLVATAAVARLATEIPEAVRSLNPETAAAASVGFPFRDGHPFPRCVACGTARTPGQPSLRLHCGPVDEFEVFDDAGQPTPLFADRWVPEADVADQLATELVAVAACWSALDCPSAAPFADPNAELPSVLARLAVRLEAPARVGEPHVLAAWRRSVDGRKQRSTSVLLDAGGTVLGVAEALWIQVRPR